MIALKTFLMKMISVIIMAWAFQWFISVFSVHATPQFFALRKNGQIAQPLDMSQIWFYDRHMNLIVPELDPMWISIVFDPKGGSASEIGDKADHFARRIMDNFPKFMAYFYDSNIAEDVCFFKLKTAANPSELEFILLQLNRFNQIAYACPTFHIDSKHYAFFNTFKLSWKKGVSEQDKLHILKQMHTLKDSSKGFFRIDLYNTALFPAIHLLAQDMFVEYAFPVLVEISPSISCDFSVDFPGGNIGDPIPFKLFVKYSDQVRIEESSFSTIDIRPKNLQKDLFSIEFDPYDYVKISKNNPASITGRLILYTPGEFIIPSIPIRYTCNGCPKETVKTFETRPVKIKIASILPSDSPSALIGLADPIDVPEKLSFKIQELKKGASRDLWHSLFFFFLSFLSLLFLLNRRKAGESMDSVQERGNGHETVQKALLQLLDSDFTTPQWKYFPGMSELMRDYVVRRFNLKDLTVRGSSDVFLNGVRRQLPAKIMCELDAIFAEIDTVIAREMACHENWKDFKSRLISFLNEKKDDHHH